MKVIDIEATWNVNHEDLPSPFFFSGTALANEISSAINSNDINSHHGTAVGGVLAARDDGHGMTGIASEAQWGASSVVRAEALRGVLGWTSGIHDASVADATLRALDALDAGDVIVIEQHSPGPPTANACSNNCSQFEFVPMEYYPDSFDAFSTASALGIVVVEAAGNGTSNLDLNVYEGRFDRTLRDSGAIMVGASQSTSRTPNGSSNSGSRIDVHAWGVNVATLGYGDIRANGGDVNQFYTSSFSGTSSASPIVAGAVLSIQGVLKDSGHGVLTPEDPAYRPDAEPARGARRVRQWHGERGRAVWRAIHAEMRGRTRARRSSRRRGRGGRPRAADLRERGRRGRTHASGGRWRRHRVHAPLRRRRVRDRDEGPRHALS
jgi:hypothetical protein